jgi:hypothetical protein
MRTTEGNVITSMGKSVHLDSGTQLLLRVKMRAGQSCRSR